MDLNQIFIEILWVGEIDVPSLVNGVEIAKSKWYNWLIYKKK